jgi:hypothetical protein
MDSSFDMALLSSMPAIRKVLLQCLGRPWSGGKVQSLCLAAEPVAHDSQFGAGHETVCDLMH